MSPEFVSPAWERRSCPGPGCVGSSAGSPLGGFAVRQLIAATCERTRDWLNRTGDQQRISGPQRSRPISEQRLGVGGRWDIAVAMNLTESPAPCEELTWRR